MKTFKIFLGFIFIISSASSYEYSNYNNFLSPETIASFFVILISTWLIGSGFSYSKFKLKSFEFFKFLVISLITFIFFAFISLSKNRSKEIMKINGYNFPIGECIDNNKEFIQDPIERKDFCICIAENLSSKENIEINDSIYKNKLTVGIFACASNYNVSWTSNISQAMKEAIKADLINTGLDKFYKVDTFCNCILNEYQKYPLKQVINPYFKNSSLAAEVHQYCSAKSFKE